MTTRADPRNSNPILRMTNEEMKSYIRLRMKSRGEALPRGFSSLRRAQLIQVIETHSLNEPIPKDFIQAAIEATAESSKFISSNINYVDSYLARLIINSSLLVFDSSNEGERIAILIINKFKDDLVVIKDSLEACMRFNSSLIPYIESLIVRSEKIRSATPIHRGNSRLTSRIRKL